MSIDDVCLSVCLSVLMHLLRRGVAMPSVTVVTNDQGCYAAHYCMLQALSVDIPDSFDMCVVSDRFVRNLEDCTAAHAVPANVTDCERGARL